MNEVLGGITIILVLWVYTTYIARAVSGKITPHPFSWSIWIIIMGVVVAAQMNDNAGPGMWANAVVFFANIIITLIALKNGFKNISKVDVFVFALGVLAIPAWILTSDPLYAVLLVCFANICAFIPTFRKSWLKPNEEPLDFFAINVVRHSLSIMALAHYSLVTTLALIVFAVCNALLLILLIMRRKILFKQRIKHV